MVAETVKQQCLDRLTAGSNKLALSLSNQVSERLLNFIGLLDKWNQAYNLTAVRDPLEMVERHVIDSLSILPYLTGERILDLGTGAGLPGIPLAMLMPDRQFVLLDSNSKKIRFVRQAILELGLENVQTVHARVENYRPEIPFDTLITRAFASLPKILELTRSLRAANSRLFAMKGTLPKEDIERLAVEYRVEVKQLHTPPALGERHLIIISQAQEKSS